MAFRSSAAASSNTGGAITATPTGVAAHDYLCGMMIRDNTSGAVSVPTAWNAALVITGTADGQLYNFSDKNDASGADAFQWNTNDGNSASLVNSAFSGRDNTTPRSTTIVQTNNNSLNASPISASFSGITALNADDIAVFMGTDQNTQTATWTFSTISGYTERQDGQPVDWCSGIALDTRDNVSAGATGSLASTITRATGTGSAGYAGFVVAIKSAAGHTPVAADTITLSDSAVSITQRLSVATDTVTLSDSAVSVTQRLSVASDTITLTDSAAGGSVLPAVASDSISLADSAVSISQLVTTASDTLALTDAADSITQRLSVAVDSLSLTDSATASHGTLISDANDAVTLTDSAVSISQRLSVATDSIILLDSAVAHNTTAVAVASDFLSLTDSAICVSSAAAVSSATPGRRLRLPNQVRGETEEEKRERRIRQGILPSPEGEAARRESQQTIERLQAKIDESVRQLAIFKARAEAIEAKRTRTARTEAKKKADLAALAEQIRAQELQALEWEHQQKIERALAEEEAVERARQEAELADVAFIVRVLLEMDDVAYLTAQLRGMQ